MNELGKIKWLEDVCDNFRYMYIKLEVLLINDIDAPQMYQWYTDTDTAVYIWYIWYDMTILVFTQKLTDASLIYRTGPKTKTSKMK